MRVEKKLKTEFFMGFSLFFFTFRRRNINERRVYLKMQKNNPCLTNVNFLSFCFWKKL